MAAAAGVSHGLIFQYFGSKKGLYRAGLEEVVAEFQRRITPDPSLPAEERLRASLGAFVDWAAGHPKGFRSLMLRTSGFSEIQQLMEDARREGAALIAEGLGLDIDDPPVRVALRGWIGFVEASLLTWVDRQAPSRDELIELFGSVLLSAAAFAQPSDG